MTQPNLLPDSRWVCLTFLTSSPDHFARAVEASAPGIDCAELRADTLPPESLRDGSWRRLPARTDLPLLFTWRSPGEGGLGGTRPAGLLGAALDAGFAWVDVEGDALDAAEAEAEAVPPPRRWVSRHLPGAPRGRDLLEIWRGLRRHPGALHKLVLRGEDFGVNDTVLELLAGEARGEGAVSVFSMGVPGAPSRVLGGLAGNAVTFAAPAEEAGTAPGQPDVDRLVGLYRFRSQPARPPLYGVLGRHVEASLSPDMHNRAFAREDLPGLYLPFCSDRPEPVLAWLRDGRVRGLSVTQPFKEEAARAADRLDPAAARVGAVNTLTLRDGVVEGGNTDRHAVTVLLDAAVPEGGKAAVIGAGGAALAAADGLRGLGAAVTLFNRDPRRGEEAARRGRASWGGAPDALDPGEYPVVVNATPMGVGSPVVRALQSRTWSGVTFLDLAYGSAPSLWERLVRDTGGRYIDGRRFLAVQGAEQFRLWTGRRVAPDRFGEGILR